MRPGVTAALALLCLVQTVYGHILVQLTNQTTLPGFLNLYPDLSSGITKTFSFGTFQGFCGDFDTKTIRSLVQNPLTAKVSPDVHVEIEDVQVQENAPRHLQRISQREMLDRDSTNEYEYDLDGQEDIDVYVIDTGVFVDHADFEGRARHGADFTGEGPSDRNGHGTHVAGLIGSKTYGVAKGVNLIDVKVLTTEGDGNLSTVIAGIEHAVNSMQNNGNPRTSLANMSLGAIFNTMLNSAVNAAVKSGLQMVVAAGNTNTAACATSPASSLYAITVGAIDDRNDTIAPFSNWGSCVDIFASGVYVHSLGNVTGSVMALSGTSMASPIVTGMMAVLLADGRFSRFSPKDVADYIINTSTYNAIARRSILFRPRTPNRIAYIGDIDDDSDEASEYSHNAPPPPRRKGLLRRLINGELFSDMFLVKTQKAQTAQKPQGQREIVP